MTGFADPRICRSAIRTRAPPVGNAPTRICFGDRPASFGSEAMLAPVAGIAPATHRLTADCSAAELHRNKLERVAGYAPALPVWKTGALLLDDTRNQGPGGMCPRAVIVSPGSQLAPRPRIEREPPAFRTGVQADYTTSANRKGALYQTELHRTYARGGIRTRDLSQNGCPVGQNWLRAPVLPRVIRAYGAQRHLMLPAKLVGAAGVEPA